MSLIKLYSACPNKRGGVWRNQDYQIQNSISQFKKGANRNFVRSHIFFIFKPVCVVGLGREVWVILGLWEYLPNSKKIFVLKMESEHL